jgi:predicted NACHT family NTPase
VRSIGSDPIDEAYPQAGKPGEANSVSVSEVFTTLYLARLTRSLRQKIAEIRKQDEHSLHQKKKTEAEEEEERFPIQAVEAVAVVPRLVVLGQPGGGKSTLVNYIATQLARRRLKELVAKGTLLGWREEEKPLPVRIILRRFAAWIPADKSHGTAGLVWDYLENQLQQGGCKEVFPHLKQQLTDEGGIIFFDGLDEVRETDEETRRSLITEAISEFAAPLKKCRVLVTCREYAYKRGDAWHLLEADFPVVELDLFKDEQIAHFTQTWYQVVGPQKGWDEKKCQDEARNLRQAIQDWPHLQELAQYPLLLTLMAQVHGRDGYLPKDRADLYERAINLLLARWENRIVRDIHGSRKVEPGLVMQLGVRTDKLRSALERVAFAAHERQEQEQARSERAADIPKEELREELRAELESLDKAEQVIAYIQERAGLLQARDNRTYAFPHRTFQEYLAATHILKQSEFDVMLRDRVRRDLTWWREVFLLAAGASGSTPRIISDLVDCLVFKGPEQEMVSPNKAQQVQAIAQALVETDFAEHVRKERINEPGRFSTTYERIQKWLIAAVRSAHTLAAGERAACGDTLARLGDPRFRPEAWYLPDEPLLGFVEIPDGPFLMGSNKKRDSGAYGNDLRQHKGSLGIAVKTKPGSTPLPMFSTT